MKMQLVFFVVVSVLVMGNLAWEPPSELENDPNLNPDLLELGKKPLKDFEASPADLVGNTGSKLANEFTKNEFDIGDDDDPDDDPDDEELDADDEELDSGDMMF